MLSLNPLVGALQGRGRAKEGGACYTTGQAAGYRSQRMLLVDLERGGCPSPSTSASITDFQCTSTY